MYPRWRYYPVWRKPEPWVEEVLGVFATAKHLINSAERHLESPAVLAHLRPGLEAIGFRIEGAGKLTRPVLFGDEGSVVKSFNVDGFREADGLAREVEAGGAVYNNRILLDLIKMCLAVDVRSGIIAVPQQYMTPKQTWQPPYTESLKLFDSIYANPERFRIPLDGLLVVGY